MSFGWQSRQQLKIKKTQLPLVEGCTCTIVGHVATFTRPDGTVALQTQVPLGAQRKGLKAAARFNAS